MEIVPVSARGEEYLGHARFLLSRLIARRKLLGVARLERTVWLDGATFILTSTETLDRATIVPDATGFLAHPRTGPIALRPFYRTCFDGWGGPYPKEELHPVVDGRGFPNGDKAYPLIDGDHGSASFAKGDGGWGYDTAPFSEDYGNITWFGKDGEVLSIKGPPGRCVPITNAEGAVDFTLAVPGVTVLDEQLEVMGFPVDYYTPFTEQIYRGGDRYAVSPQGHWPERWEGGAPTSPPVLGAAFAFDPQGRRWLLCVACVNYRSAPNYPQGGKGFYFTCFARLDGEEWQKLGELRAERPSTPFFFNASGTEAHSVQGETVYKVAVTLEKLAAVFTSYPATSGREHYAATHNAMTSGTRPTTQQLQAQASWDGREDYAGIKGFNGRRVEAKDTATASISRSAERIFCIDYRGDTPVIAKFVLSSTDANRCELTEYEEYGLCYVVYPVPPGSVGVSGPCWPDVGDVFSTQNMCQPRWSASCGEIDQNGVWTDECDKCSERLVVSATDDLSGEMSQTCTRSYPPVRITAGPVPINIGSTVSASGGVGPPYTFAAAGCSVSVNGDGTQATVTALGQCYPGASAFVTFTAEDECQHRATGDFAQAGGAYVLTNAYDTGGYGHCYKTGYGSNCWLNFAGHNGDGSLVMDTDESACPYYTKYQQNRLVKYVAKVDWCVQWSDWGGGNHNQECTFTCPSLGTMGMAPVTIECTDYDNQGALTHYRIRFDAIAYWRYEWKCP